MDDAYWGGKSSDGKRGRGAHLLRELKFIVDAHDYAWARNMKRLLQGT